MSIEELNINQDRFTEKTALIAKINELIRAVNALAVSEEKVEKIKKTKK